jgi:hypothetical protein
VLDKLAPLYVQHIFSDHSPPGDGLLIALERNFINDVRTRSRSLTLKSQRVSVADAGKQLNLQIRYSDWPEVNVAGLVQRIDAEGN